jgi:hypothetical protein
MSDISDSARVSLIVADFANVDGSGKLNIIGGGVAITGQDPRTGGSAPFSVVVLSQVDPKFQGQEYALELGLYSAEDGEVFVPSGPIEQPPVRVAQMVTVEPVRAPKGTYLPAGVVWPGAQMVVNFQTGLPLPLGKPFEWRVSIDGNVVATTGLFMAGPPNVLVG